MLRCSPFDLCENEYTVKSKLQFPVIGLRDRTLSLDVGFLEGANWGFQYTNFLNFEFFKFFNFSKSLYTKIPIDPLPKHLHPDSGYGAGEFLQFPEIRKHEVLCFINVFDSFETFSS